MTKRRAPLTVEAALTTIAGQLPGSFEELGEKLDLSGSYLRKCSDPHQNQQISLRDAIRASILYREANGAGAPMFETFAYQLQEAGALKYADEYELGHHSTILIKEAAEANAAVVLASQPHGSDFDRNQRRAHARRELEESIAVQQKALLMLDAGEGEIKQHASPANKHTDPANNSAQPP